MNEIVANPPYLCKVSACVYVVAYSWLVCSMAHCRYHAIVYSMAPTNGSMITHLAAMPHSIAPDY